MIIILVEDQLMMRGRVEVGRFERDSSYGIGITLRKIKLGCEWTTETKLRSELQVGSSSNWSILRDH